MQEKIEIPADREITPTARRLVEEKKRRKKEGDCGCGKKKRAPVPTSPK